METVIFWTRLPAILKLTTHVLRISSRLDFGGGSEADHEDNDGMLDPEDDDFEREDHLENDKEQQQQQQQQTQAPADHPEEEDDDDEDDEDDEQCKRENIFVGLFIQNCYLLSPCLKIKIT